MKRFFAICLMAGAAGLSGCGSSEPTNLMEDADQAAVDAYEAAVAEQDAAMEADADDAAP